MIAKFAEDDRIEQMNAQKRRMKQLEHRREVERLIEERRAQYQRQKVNITHHHHFYCACTTAQFVALLL